MTVHSIRTAVEIGDVSGKHLLVSAGEMPFREVKGIRELDDLTQKVGPRTKALDDAGYLLPTRSGTPEIVRSSSLSGGLVVFDDTDFRITPMWV